MVNMMEPLFVARENSGDGVLDIKVALEGEGCCGGWSCNVEGLGKLELRKRWRMW